MNNNIDYFIIGHTNQVLSKLSKTCNIETTLPRVNYVLVGNNHKAQSKKLTIAKSLKFNIEQHYNLCSYTAWYSIAKNNLSGSDYVSLLEYDIDITQNFHQHTQTKVSNTQSDKFIIAYSSTLFDHYVFYKSTPWLEIFLKKIYNIDIEEFITNHKDKYLFWPTTTNITMPRYILDNFVEWFNPFIDLCNNHSLGSYVHERAFFVYCVLNNIQVLYLNNVLQHKQLQSHGIYDIYGKFLHQKQTTILTEAMKPEYDLIYDQAYKNCEKHTAATRTNIGNKTLTT